MTSMTTTTGAVIGGVDTHDETNHAAVLDELGRQLGDREFPTTPSGYRQLLAWLGSHGQISSIGMEGTALTAPGWRGICTSKASRWSRSSDPTAKPAGARAVRSLGC